MLVAHLPIAVVEGLVTGSVVVLLRKVRPEVLGGVAAGPGRPVPGSLPARAAAAGLGPQAQRLRPGRRADDPRQGILSRGGGPAIKIQVTALDPEGHELGRATTDQAGKFRWRRAARCDYRLVAQTGDGHGAEYTVPAAELPAALPGAVRPRRRALRRRQCQPRSQARRRAPPAPCRRSLLRRRYRGPATRRVCSPRVAGPRAPGGRPARAARRERESPAVPRLAGRNRLHPGSGGHRLLRLDPCPAPGRPVMIPHALHADGSWLATGRSPRADPGGRGPVGRGRRGAADADDGVALAAAGLAVGLAGLPAGTVLRRLLPLEVILLLLVLVLPWTARGEPLVSSGWPAPVPRGTASGRGHCCQGQRDRAGGAGPGGHDGRHGLGHALAHLHVPRKLAHLLLFTVRYLDVLEREYRRLRAAMKVRSFRPRMNRHTYRAYGYLVGMLLVRSFDRSERVLAAMKCRGFRGRFYLLDHFAFCRGATCRSARPPRCCWRSYLGWNGHERAAGAFRRR